MPSDSWRDGARRGAQVNRCEVAGCEGRGKTTALEQAQLLGAAPRRTEMVGRQPRSRLVEAALLAGEFEAAADHPGHRPAAGHALAPARIVVLTAAGLAEELEHVAVAVGEIGHQPFAEQVAHFKR